MSKYTITIRRNPHGRKIWRSTAEVHKKWWEYFWDYYKWHVIITVVAVLIASVTIVQCATRPKYDMNVVYAGHMNYSEEEINNLKEIISEHISDIDGNGENSVLLSTLILRTMQAAKNTTMLFKQSLT